MTTNPVRETTDDPERRIPPEERAEWPPGMDAEALRLIWSLSPSTTIGQIRSALRRLARKNRHDNW